ASPKASRELTDPPSCVGSVSRWAGGAIAWIAEQVSSSFLLGLPVLVGSLARQSKPLQGFPPRRARTGRAYRSAELRRIGKPAGRGYDSLDCRAGFWLVLARSGSVCPFCSVLWLGNLSLSQGFPRAYLSTELRSIGKAVG